MNFGCLTASLVVAIALVFPMRDNGTQVRFLGQANNFSPSGIAQYMAIAVPTPSITWDV